MRYFFLCLSKNVEDGYFRCSPFLRSHAGSSCDDSRRWFSHDGCACSRRGVCSRVEPNPQDGAQGLKWYVEHKIT